MISLTSKLVLKCWTFYILKENLTLLIGFLRMHKNIKKNYDTMLYNYVMHFNKDNE